MKEKIGQNKAAMNGGDGTPLPLTKTNFILMAVCGLLIVCGFLLMLGGANDGETFNADVFSTRRIIVGPTMAFIGFVAMAVAIIYKKKDKKDSDKA